jgi:hypothetical protein
VYLCEKCMGNLMYQKILGGRFLGPMEDIND